MPHLRDFACESHPDQGVFTGVIVESKRAAKVNWPVDKDVECQRASDLRQRCILHNCKSSKPLTKRRKMSVAKRRFLGSDKTREKGFSRVPFGVLSSLRTSFPMYRRLPDAKSH